MASVPIPPPGGMRLSELLKEKQEPFQLDVYLLENGYSSRILNSQPPIMCWPGGRRLQRLSSSGSFSRRAGFLRCVLTKLVYGKGIRKALNWESKSNANGRLGVPDCFPEMASKTHKKESDIRHKCSCMEMENSKQLSPVSVLELHSGEASPFHRHRGKGDKHSTSSLDWPSMETSVAFEQMLEHSCFSPPTSHYGKPKRMLNQFNQLLLDCLGELEEKILESDGCLDPERAKVIIQEQILSWWKLRGTARSTTQLVESDLSNSRKEWSLFHPQLREIGMGIEAAIFEEIREEAILDMLNCHCTYEKL